MSEYTTILYEIKGPVCYITLNRPDKLNAINREMATELLDSFHRVRDEASVAVVVLTGQGKAFCTGGDLSIFPSLAEHMESMNWLAHQGYGIGKAIELCEKVVIAKVTGHCLAGGLELALMCDLIYAKETAKFGTTEINMGILPGWGGTVRIARALPIYRAREIIYSGRKDFLAKDMYEMGFLTRVFKDDEFESQVWRGGEEHQLEEDHRPAHGQGGHGALAGVRQHGCGPGPGAERHPVADLCPGHPGGHGHPS